MIKVNNLKKKYDARGIAGLSGVSFSLNEGEVMGLMGPNGSGKTTLLNILSNKLQAESGEFKIDGKISFFPSLKIEEDSNVQKFLISRITLDIEEEKKIQLARDLADTFEFTFQLRQKLSELSSGQKQKILLAGELINRPALLLMDEPFTHLDPFTRKDILNGLFQYIRGQGITVLWVTHELEEALRFSDKIGIMNFGKFEQWANPRDLLWTPKNLFVAQFVGYQNFFSVKLENQKCLTPWGPWKSSLKDQEEAILVIPNDAWIIDPKSSWKAEVIEAYPSRQKMEYRLRFGEQVFTINLPIQDPILDIGTQVSLSPRENECFLIPL